MGERTEKRRVGRGEEWSDSDLKLLAAGFHTTSLAELARRLGRSVSAVANEASVLGMKRNQTAAVPGRIVTHPHPGVTITRNTLI
ncbi:MAG: hypothetical protein ACK4KV_09465 [Rhodocyclaceae bacterium]